MFRVLHLFHRFSLDAPLVAVGWAMLMYRLIQPERALTAAHLTVLGLSVWLAYLGDRWLDAWRLERKGEANARHSHFAEQRWLWLLIWLAVLAADVALALWQLFDPGRIANGASALASGDLRLGLGLWVQSDFLRGGVLTALALLYVLSAQRGRQKQPRWLPKEMQTTLLFLGSIFLFVAEWSLGTLFAVAIYGTPLGMLVYGNLVYLAAWDRAGTPEEVRDWEIGGRICMLGAIILPLIFFVGPAVLRDYGFLTFLRGGLFAYLLGALGLLLLDLLPVARRLDPLTRRALADAVLLGPWLFVWW